MSSELLPPPLPATKPPSIPSTATTHATAADGTTTISSLGGDQLLEIFLHLPNLPSLVHAALTCRSWLSAVRTSRPFRCRFRALHPVPLLGLFLEVDDDTTPSFAPLRRTDPDVAAALRCGDFFLTSLPAQDGAHTGWSILDYRDGYILLWNMMSLAAVNPMTWAVDIIPLPEDATEGCLPDFACLGFHLLSTEEDPWSFRVVCICADVSRVCAAVFSSETWDWAIHPWVEIGGDNSLKYNAGMLVDGSVYWPFHGERRMIRINTATMDITNVDLRLQVDVERSNYKAGETRDGQICIVYASDDFLLHVWIRGVDGDGIGNWVLQTILSLSGEIDRITLGLQVSHLRVVQVKSGYVYLSMTCMTLAGILSCWFLSLSLETMKTD